MSVKLTENRILVEAKKAEEKTSGGIVVPYADEEKNTTEGTVVDVGPGFTSKSGKIVPVQVNEGERILYLKDAGDKVTLDEKTFVILKDDEVLAVLDD